VKYLVVEDFAFSLVCLIQCCLNLHHQGQFGESIGCIFEAWQVNFFVCITGYSLALIAYSFRRRVTSLKEVKNPPIFKIHLVFWTAGVVFATCGAVWPGSARMNLSGTYCIPAYENLWPAIFFFGLCIIPVILWLAFQYSWIFVYYKKITSHEHGHTRKQLRLARQLAVFVVIYFIFYLPFLLSAIYEWCTHYYAVVSFDFVAGIFTHMCSVANPVMYLWVTKPCRDEIKTAVGLLTISTSKEEDAKSSQRSDTTTTAPTNPLEKTEVQ